MAIVLIVDDEPTFLSSLGQLLSRRGYDVLSANGPRKALEILSGEPTIDLVLCDITMPEMRGTDLIREIADKLPQTACVLMTGGVVNSGEVPHDVPVLRKPIPINDLLVAIQDVLNNAAPLKSRASTQEN